MGDKKTKDGFFLSVFDKILQVNDETVMIVFDIVGDIWFKFKDLLRAIGYGSIHHIMLDMKITTSYKKQYKDIKVLQSTAVPSNFQKNAIFINESGLYEVLSVSTKPLAKLFMKKYFTEIMPQIKKTGMYFLESKEREKLLKLNAKIDKLKEKNTNLSDENNFLESKHRYKSSDNGYGYIAETTCINNGKVSVCYKFGVTDDIEKRIRQYRTGNSNFFFISHLK